MPTLRDLVRTARLARGMTQDDLAEVVDMSQRWLSDVEAGKIKRPRPEVARRLADVLGLDLADLYAAWHVTVMPLR